MKCAAIMVLLLAAPLLADRALAAEPQVHRDLAYAEPKNERQTLDVYAPAEGKNHPIIFWIHGGGWQRGDKAEVQAKPQAFVDKGFVFVSTNYRFVPDVTIQQMAGDIARSFRWAFDHAAEYGGDRNTIFVMGHSAGAQLAALIATDERYLKAEKLSLSNIKGCVPVDGDTYDVPLQIATVEQRRKEIYAWKFGDVASQLDLSPISHVPTVRGLPPFLLLHVADHPEVSMQAKKLALVLQQAKASAQAFAAADTNHVRINAELGLPDDPPTKAVFAFLDAILKKQ